MTESIKRIQRIDSHQHFWIFDPIRDSWINEEMRTIQRDFLPAELQLHLINNKLDGCVTVQSDQSEEENKFQLANAELWDFIKGVVGWVDLQGENIEERLMYYSQFKKMKGFRHVLQAETQRDYMLRPAFKKGIGLLKRHSFTFDILIFPDQLQFSYDLVKAFPDQPFVLNHIAKPDIKNGRIETWKKDIQKLASCKNVFCKASGMVTEAHWSAWKNNDFFPYLDVVTEAFGTERIMFGSDWPVCLVAAEYGDTVSIVKDYYTSFSKDEQERIFGGNASRFYNLEV